MHLFHQQNRSVIVQKKQRLETINWGPMDPIGAGRTELEAAGPWDPEGPCQAQSYLCDPWIMNPVKPVINQLSYLLMNQLSRLINQFRLASLSTQKHNRRPSHKANEFLVENETPIRIAIDSE